MSDSLTDQQIQDYVDGKTIHQVALGTIFSDTFVRSELKAKGVLRSRTESMRLSLINRANTEWAIKLEKESECRPEKRGLASSVRDRSRLPPESRLTQKENGIHYDAVLSQLWISKSICN